MSLFKNRSKSFLICNYNLTISINTNYVIFSPTFYLTIFFIRNLSLIKATPLIRIHYLKIKSSLYFSFGREGNKHLSYSRSSSHITISILNNPATKQSPFHRWKYWGSEWITCHKSDSWEASWERIHWLPKKCFLETYLSAHYSWQNRHPASLSSTRKNKYCRLACSLKYQKHTRDRLLVESLYFVFLHGYDTEQDLQVCNVS